MQYDNPGNAIFSGDGNILNDMASIMSGAHSRGYIACDTRPGASERISKSKKKTGPKPKTKYTRCPSCGGKVIAPCILCNPESTYDKKLNSSRVDPKSPGR